jgi:hypothetical protein
VGGLVSLLDLLHAPHTRQGGCQSGSRGDGRGTAGAGVVASGSWAAERLGWKGEGREKKKKGFHFIFFLFFLFNFKLEHNSQIKKTAHQVHSSYKKIDILRHEMQQSKLL